MSVTAKPYSRALKLVRSVFDGKPSVFTAEDLNRQLDAMSDSIIRNNDHIGAMSKNLGISAGGSNAIINSGGDTELTAEVTIQQKVAGDVFVYYKGVEFDITSLLGTLGPTVFTKTGEDKILPAYVYLVAEKVQLTYSDDPVNSGVTFSGALGSLPSSETILYRNARLTLVEGVSGITLGANEEVICVVATFRQSRIFNETSLEDEMINRWELNTIDVEGAAFQLGSEPALNFSHTESSDEVVYENNNSVFDALFIAVRFFKHYKERFDGLITSILDGDISGFFNLSGSATEGDYLVANSSGEFVITDFKTYSSSGFTLGSNMATTGLSATYNTFSWSHDKGKGQLKLRGEIHPTSAISNPSHILGTLPASVRPSKSVWFGVPYLDAGGYHIAPCHIATTGVITAWTPLTAIDEPFLFDGVEITL